MNATLNRLLSPEFLWRRSDRPYVSMVRTLSFLFAIDLYVLSASQRSDLGRFFASLPETAAFVLLRAKHEAFCCVRDENKADRLAWQVICRLFGRSGAAALQEVTRMFSEAKTDEFSQISQDASYLALGSVVDLKHVANLSNFNVALERGKAIMASSANAEASAEAAALLGAHWLKCGDQIQSHYESWLMADRSQQAIARIPRKLEGG